MRGVLHLLTVPNIAIQNPVDILMRRAILSHRYILSYAFGEIEFCVGVAGFYKETLSMKFYSLFSMFVSIALFASQSFAESNRKVLLISDIDDTIKSSHVLNTYGKIGRAGNVTIRFSGMAQLYQLIVNENPLSTKIVYLSNAPKQILDIPIIRYGHQMFLNYNNFPYGELDLRESIFEKDHKIKELRRMITKEKPDVVIMIGDNGEQDAAIYRQATLELQNENLKMVTFIHQLYSVNPNIVDEVLGTDCFSEKGHALEANQTGFVTPVEIAIELNRQKLLSDDKKQWMIDKVAPFIASESIFASDVVGTITFPVYINCSDFKWQWEITNDLRPLVSKIERSCR